MQYFCNDFATSFSFRRNFLLWRQKGSVFVFFRARGRAFPPRSCPLRHGLRRATSPEVGGKGSSATFLALPLGELSSGARLRGLVFPPAALPSPSRLAPCHLPRSGRQGLLRCVLGSPFGRAVERSETERARFSVSDLALSVTACAVPPLPK